jgi:hypothetical protein
MERETGYYGKGKATMLSSRQMSKADRWKLQ